MVVRRFCIIYNGLIRGFKYDDVIQTHRDKLWSPLEKAGIEYDIFLVTNNAEYDAEAVKKIPNLKKVLILDVAEIKASDMFRRVSQALSFGCGKCSQPSPFQNYIVSILNKTRIMQQIGDTYSRYLSMDIAQTIDRLEPSILSSLAGIYSPGWGCNLGHNDRLLIGDYKTAYMYNHIADYILKREKITSHNPECLVAEMFKASGIQVQQPESLRVTRVRGDGSRPADKPDAAAKTMEQLHELDRKLADQSANPRPVPRSVPEGGVRRVKMIRAQFQRLQQRRYHLLCARYSYLKALQY